MRQKSHKGLLYHDLDLITYLKTTDKTSFRPVSVLSLLTKVFERIFYSHLGKYMDTFFSKLLCGFRKTPLLSTSSLSYYNETEGT